MISVNRYDEIKKQSNRENKIPLQKIKEQSRSLKKIPPNLCRIIIEHKKYLTGNLPLIKRRIRRVLRLITRQRVDVNRVMLFMPFEELLPKRRQRQGPFRQEHKRDLGNSLVWILLQLRNKRSSPKELLIAHVVHQTRWRPNPTTELVPLINAALNQARPILKDCIFNIKIASPGHANHQEHKTQSQEQQKNLDYLH